MTAFRLIPLQVHGALEMLVGLFAMAAPFLLGFEPAATVVSVVVGAVLVGLALAATAAGEPAGPGAQRGTLAVGTHHAADYGISIGLVGAAALVALDGDGVAGVTLGLLALTQLALNLTTKYSLRG